MGQILDNWCLLSDFDHLNQTNIILKTVAVFVSENFLQYVIKDVDYEKILKNNWKNLVPLESALNSLQKPNYQKSEKEYEFVLTRTINIYL